MHIVVASKNPTKVSGVRDAFERVFADQTNEALNLDTHEISPNPSFPKEGDTGTSPFGQRGIEGDFDLIVTGVKVDTGVGEQPVGDEETKQGSLNRALAVQQLEPDADYWVGVEGGVVWHPSPVTGEGQRPESDTDAGQGELECMAWITIIGSDGRIGKARSNGFLLPPAMAALIANGVPQNLADDQIIGRQDSGTTNGTVGHLSHNLIDRTHYTADAVILALAPFLHPELYPVEVLQPAEVTTQ